MAEEAALVAQTDQFETFELADEDQIIAELSGRITEKYIYTFKQDGQEVTGLSYAGTNWACREYAKQGEAIRVTKVEKEPDPFDPEFVLVTVYAQRFAINRENGKETALDNTVVTKRQCRFMDKKRYENGQVVGRDQVPDKFFWEKAVSKGVRNAKQALMPTDFVKKIIQRALEGKVQGGRANGGSRPQQRQGGPQRPPSGPPPHQPPPQAERPPAGPPPQRPAPSGSPPQRPPAGPPPQQPPARPPEQQRPPAGPPPQRPPAPPQPPARPAAQQRPPAPPPQRPAPSPAPGVPHQTVSRPDQSPREAAIDALQQRFDTLLWQVAGRTKDRRVMMTILKDLTGFIQVSDLSAEQMNELGPLLKGVINGTNVLQNGVISDKATGEQLWPRMEPQYEDAPPPQMEPPAEGAPPQEEDLGF